MQDERSADEEFSGTDDQMVSLTADMFEDDDGDDGASVIDPAPFVSENAAPQLDETDAGSDHETQTATDEAPADEAVGISYDEGKDPVISAIGKDERAAAIIAMAKEEGIYIHKDKVLLDELKKLKEGEEIPKELFAIIATILSFSYLLQGKTPESWTRPDGTVSVNTTI